MKNIIITLALLLLGLPALRAQDLPDNYVDLVGYDVSVLPGQGLLIECPPQPSTHYENGVPVANTGESLREVPGRFVLQGLPTENNTAGGDPIRCVAVPAGVVTVEGSTFHVYKFLKQGIPGDRNF